MLKLTILLVVGILFVTIGSIIRSMILRHSRKTMIIYIIFANSVLICCLVYLFFKGELRELVRMLQW